MATETDVADVPMTGRRKKSVRRPKGGPWLSTDEAAEQMGLATQTLVNWRAARTPGRPLAYLIGRHVWYLATEITDWIESRRETA